MANNYCVFSEKFKFPKEAAEDLISLCNDDFDDFPQWFVDKHNLTDENVDDYFDNNIRTIGSFGVNVTYEENSELLYICAEESGDIEAVAKILSEVMGHYNINKPIIIEEALYCSRMIPGEFGGCVVAVGPDVYLLKDTYKVGTELAKKISEGIKHAER
jgi:hypothetical protein